MKKWAVLAQKGGSGKTTLTLHLATVAVAEGLKTAVLDVDPQGNTAQWSQLREADRPHVVRTSVPQLARELGLLASDRFDLAIIDTSPRIDRDMLDLLKLADLLVIPARPSILDLHAIRETMQHIEAAASLARVVIVINAFAPRTGEADEVRPLLASLGTVAKAQIGDRVPLRRALTAGKGVVEFDPKSSAAQEIRALYSELAKY